MAIELITGLPGNAKTLHAMQRTIERSSSEQRPVYYSGLKGFNPEDERLKGITWTEFDPLTWYETVPQAQLHAFPERCQVYEYERFSEPHR